jgi:hypothetical protein
MFGHRSFLMIGGNSPADIKSLISEGYEILDLRFGFKQGIGANGKATTAVHSDVINVVLSQLPSKQIIEWALNSRKYTDGMIVTLDANNVPLEKIIFQNATCTHLKIDFLQTGTSYLTVKMEIAAERLNVGSSGDITFTNNWIYD